MSGTNKRIYTFALLSLLIIPPCIDLLLARAKTKDLVKQALAQNDSNFISINTFGSERIEILLKVEDPNFYTHKGIDLRTPGAGLTSISQGLVKKLYFKDFKPGIAKLRQSYIARFAFDPIIPKYEQLELFINIAYLGNDNGKEIRGFEQASNIFFQKTFTDLEHNEYLSLVAMLMNPNRYHVLHNPEPNRERTYRIQKLINNECHPVNWRDCELVGCK